MEAWRKIFNEQNLAVSINFIWPTRQMRSQYPKNPTLMGVGIAKFYKKGEICSSMVLHTQIYI